MAWKDVFRYLLTPYDPSRGRNGAKLQGGPVFAYSVAEWTGQGEGTGEEFWGMLDSDTVKYDLERLRRSGVKTEEQFLKMKEFEASLSAWGYRKRGEPEAAAWYDLADHGPVYDENLGVKEKLEAQQSLQKTFDDLARRNPEGAKAFAAYVKANRE